MRNRNGMDGMQILTATVITVAATLAVAMLVTRALTGVSVAEQLHECLWTIHY